MISERVFVPEIEPTPELAIGINSPGEELERVKYYIDNKDLYKKHGYKPKFPSNPLLQEPFADDEFENRVKILEEEYDEDIYLKGVGFIERYRDDIECVFRKFRGLYASWGFVMFSKQET